MKIYRTVLLSVLLALLVCGTGYTQTVRDRMDDAQADMFGKHTLRFFNAIIGTPIKNASVKIEHIGEFTTDAGGKIRFDKAGVDNGFYNVTFMAENYVTAKFKFEIMVGTIFFNWYAISPSLAAGEFRVSVIWDQKPEDLDAHFVKHGQYHISYQDMKVAKDRTARLDRDDRDGIGPETITANFIDPNATYSYYIHDFTNRKKSKKQFLAGSKARVAVFGGNNELLSLFEIPKAQKGVYWHVFDMKNGQIIPVNQVSPREP